MPTPTNDDASTTPQGRRLALVIGVNDTCSDILPGLNYALANAEAMAEVLEQKCDFTMVMPPLLGEHASSAKVKKAVLELTRNCNDDDFLLLYFSGHGQQAYDEMRTEIRKQWLEQTNHVGAEDQALIRIFAGHASSVNSVAFSPNGASVLTGSSDNTARLWERSSGQAVHTFGGHTDWVSSVAFSTDGCYVLTGSDDNTARLWERSSGQALHTFRGHSSSVNSVAFSPDGRFIVTCDDSGRVYLWVAEGPDRGRLFALYKAAYEVGAVFWQDATHLVLADKGGSRGYPNIYRLRLHGLA